jgi:hypothetical protein
MVVWQMGMTSWSSASKTLRRWSVSLVAAGDADWFLPVEVLGSADSDEGVGVCEGREDTNPEPSVSISAGRTDGFAAYSLEFSNWARTAMILWICEVLVTAV